MRKIAVSLTKGGDGEHDNGSVFKIILPIEGNLGIEDWILGKAEAMYGIKLFHRRDAASGPASRPEGGAYAPEGERREIFNFSFVAETPTNEKHHAFGSL